MIYFYKILFYCDSMLKKLTFLILFFSTLLTKDHIVLDYPMTKGIGGFFHLMTQIFGHIILFEKNMCDPIFSKKYSGLKLNLVHPQCKYFDPNMGNSFWDQYFEPIVIGTIEGNGKHLTDDKYRAFISIRNHFPKNRKEINKYINKYLIINENIINDLNFFQEKLFEKNNIIGVHYRGTDKEIIQKIKKVPYMKVKKAVDRKLRRTKGATKIFIATDEESFLNFMIEKYPQKIIYLDIQRTCPQGIHKSEDIDPYMKGYFALLDCLLLSRTNYLIWTSSTLSRWSCYFNPLLKNELLKK